MNRIDFDQFKNEVTPNDKVLVLFSGGLDCTGALYRVLTETDCKVITHHVILRNEEQRGAAELTATVQTLRYMQENIRPFKRSRSELAFGYQHFIGYDVVTTAFIASQVILGEHDVKYLVNGLTASDLADDEINRRVKRGLDIVDVALEDDEESPTLVCPVGTYLKRDTVAMLPSEIAQLTWSCRTPISKDGYAFRCGTCKTCDEIKQQNIWDKLPNQIKLP